MRKLGWLADTREKSLLVESSLKFLGVASPEEWERIYIDEEVSVAFRVFLANTKNPHSISDWLKMGELQSKEIQTLDFDKKKFKKVLIDMKELAFLMPDDFSVKLQNVCSECGVAVVYTPIIAKSSY